MAHDDTLAVQWNETETHYFRLKPKGGSWGSREDAPHTFVAMAYDSTDTLHAIGGGLWPASTYHCVRGGASSWSCETFPMGGRNGGYRWGMAIDDQDTIHVAWYSSSTVGGNDEVYYNYRPDGGSWSEPQNLSLSPTLVSRGAALAIHSTGTVYVVWAESNGGIYYASKPGGGTWTTPVAMGEGGEWATPEIAADANSYVHLAWMDNTSGNYEIYYSRTYKPTVIHLVSFRQVTDGAGAWLGLLGLGIVVLAALVIYGWWQRL